MSSFPNVSAKSDKGDFSAAIFASKAKLIKHIRFRLVCVEVNQIESPWTQRGLH